MADDGKNKALPEGEAPPKKSKFKRFLIIFLILLIVVAAGGGGAYWWFFMRVPGANPEEGQPAAQGTEQSVASKADHGVEGEAPVRIERQSILPRSTGQVLPLPQFVVNLSDAAGKRYLRLGMEIEVNQDVAALLKSQEAKVRDAVIVLLAGKTFADISTAEGKILLKAEVAARLNQILGGAYVVRVYFTEFVVEQ